MATIFVAIWFQGWLIYHSLHCNDQNGFLDASKVFDRVDLGLLFQKLVKRGLPPPILNFLMSWYRSQKMRVQWSPGCLSNSFNISNGVCQGGILSPFLFAVYLDGLLDELSASGVGCY